MLKLNRLTILLSVFTICVNAKPTKNTEIQFTEALSILDTYKFNGNEKILDLGCRFGKISMYLAQKAHKGSVLAITNSDAIDLEESSHQNLIFKKEDPTQITYDNEFDLVVSFSYFHWIKDQQTILKKISKALKKDGKALLKMGVSDAIGRKYPFHLHINTIANSKKWAPYFIDMPKSWYYPIDPKSISSMLEKADLKPVHIELIKNIATFENEQKLASWIKTWLPHLRYLPKDLHDKFTLEIANLYSQNCQKEDNKILLEKPALEVIAQKS